MYNQIKSNHAFFDKWGIQLSLKKSIISKIARVPLPLWILIIFIYIVPVLLDHPGEGPKDQIWLIYIFPAFILSFYWGIWGGLIVAILSIIIQIGSGFPPPLPPPSGSWGMPPPPPPGMGSPFMIITTTSLLSFGLAVCIGLLADRLKRIQKVVEKNNAELEKKNKQLNDMLHMDELTGLWNRARAVKIS